MENQAKSLTPRQSNFPAVHLFSAFCFFLFVVCALFCIACRSPALSLSFIGRRRVDPRKACHLGEISGKTVLDVWPKIFTFQAVDTLPEWSKGVDLSSTSANCVGSNPTGVIWLHSSSPSPTKNKVWLQQACSRPQKLLAQAELSEACHSQSRQTNSTPRGFEPLRAEPVGFRVQLLSRSDTVSSAS